MSLNDRETRFAFFTACVANRTPLKLNLTITRTPNVRRIRFALLYRYLPLR